MSRSSYNRTTTALGMAALILASALLGLPYWREEFAMADLSTGSGETHSERLADGSQLTLSADSSVTLQFSEDPHQIHLIAGQILLEAGSSPLQVITPKTRIDTHDAHLQIEYLQGTTRIRQLAGSSRIGDQLTLNAHQQVQVTDAGIEPVQATSSQ